MKLFSTMSIRGGLVLLALLCVLPALALQLYDGHKRRAHLVTDAMAEASRAAAALAQVQEHITDSTRLLLTALAAMPELRAMDSAACGSLFATLLNQNPIYANILAANDQGDVFASGLPFGHVNLSDRKHFREAMAMQQFTAGEYIISRTSGEPAFPFVLPFKSQDGTLGGLVVASIRLDAFDAAFRQLRMPAGSVFGICDRNGVRLYHQPTTATNLPGKPIRAAVWQAIDAGGAEGVALLPGSDGVQRYYAFHKLHLSSAMPAYMTFVVGVPEDSVLGPSRQALQENLILLGAAGALALAVAWLVGGAVIAGRLDRIADTAARIGQGERQARTGLLHGPSGIAKVATSLDAMADLLAANDAAKERALAALRQSQERMAHIAASMADWIWEMDAGGRCTHVGERVRDSLGYAPADLIGKTFFDLLAPGEEQTLRPIIETAWARREPIRDLVNWRLATDGSRHCLMTSGVAWHDETGHFQGYRGVDKDVTERVRAERAIRASLAEKDILLKEIHHRVKNNLQIISSLLYLQSELVEDPVALESFRVSRNRIASMALVHEEIYRSADLSHIRLDTYIQDLLPKIFGSSPSNPGLALHCRLDPVTVPIEQAVPAGLAVNELLTNAHKHALPSREGAWLRVDLRETVQDVIIVIADNGPGLPPDFEPSQTGTLGMQLVLNLAQQLGGGLSARNEGGAVFTLTFPRAAQS
ncbi:histidine kinase dimerization/phosphoacceptor domain -containing protein [Desulfovibrio sp. TomC]|uniref:histidine kinase dimerization/phosphoacceptor domain -containing protein n=1 Tax=Desulfovibrio sp. TomC TaxID=1562888 RepID=UPI0005738072|nr:histidine kinase dimerization/phosphoacceptor domain -containing protein [Desulfovibrio sp. TomC]KHK00571.1 signal transduction histidine kinase [Desulfovibrio sp. TomC]